MFRPFLSYPRPMIFLATDEVFFCILEWKSYPMRQNFIIGIKKLENQKMKSLTRPADRWRWISDQSTHSEPPSASQLYVWPYVFNMLQNLKLKSYIRSRSHHVVRLRIYDPPSLTTLSFSLLATTQPPQIRLSAGSPSRNTGHQSQQWRNFP